MVAVDAPEPAVDGRAARRERNIAAVLDAAIELFAEGDLFPGVEQVSKRSGISVRSIYRYFTDPAELADAAIEHHRQRTLPLTQLPSIGHGPVDRRIDDFVAMRLRLHTGIAAAYRATVHNATNHPRLRHQLARGRDDLRAQFERHFAPELEQLAGPAREALSAAGDALTQLDSIELLRTHRGLSEAETAAALRAGLLAILTGPSRTRTTRTTRTRST